MSNIVTWHYNNKRFIILL